MRFSLLWSKKPVMLPPHFRFYCHNMTYRDVSDWQHRIVKIGRESRRLLNYLLDHVSPPEYQVRFKWSEGAIAMWDNRYTQHYAVNDYLPAYRRIHRITVLNDRRSA